MKDADFMLAVLEHARGDWVAQQQILARSISERGCGMTVHSRAADLRADGHVVQCRVEHRAGRRVSFYRLVPSSEPLALEPAWPSAGGSEEADGRPSTQSVAGDDRLSPPLGTVAGCVEGQLSFEEAAA